MALDPSAMIEEKLCGTTMNEHSAHDVSTACLLDWLLAALNSSGKGALRVAVIILRLSLRLQRQRHIMMTPKNLAEHHLARSTAYRSLEQLERADLITVRRCQGTSPLVSIVWPGQCEADRQPVSGAAISGDQAGQ